MGKTERVLALAAAALVLLTAVSCNKLRARDQLNKGVLAFDNGRYEEAVERFKNAVSLDPSLVPARLYLATAYAQQYTPGAQTPENNRNAEQAIHEFEAALAAKPSKEQSVLALKRIGSLYGYMGDSGNASRYYKQAADVDPNDAEVYYLLAMLDWRQTYQAAAEAKAKIGLKVDDEYKNSKQDQEVCEQVRRLNEPTISEGLAAGEKALQLRPEYQDAMSCVNLLFRRKADIECGAPAARANDLKTADDWYNKALGTHITKAPATEASTGITAAQQGK